MHDDRKAAKPHGAASSASSSKSGSRTSPAPDKKEQPLRGTFVSVLLLGAFLALVWIGIFALFIARD